MQPLRWNRWPAFAVVALVVGACAVNPRASDSPAIERPTMTRVPTTTVAPTRDSGLSFPGKQADDYGTGAGQSVSYGDGVSVVSEPLRLAKTSSGRFLCTAVTIANSTARAVPFNPFDWKLQNPAGVIRDHDYGGSKNQLESGELASGGSVSGDVCFPYSSKPGSGGGSAPTGTWVVLMEPAAFSGERIGWVNVFSDATTSASSTTTTTSASVPAAAPGYTDPTTWPTAVGNFSSADQPGWVYFIPESSSVVLGCGIGPDGTAGCDIVPDKVTEMVPADRKAPGTYGCDMPGMESYRCPIPPQGTKNVVVQTDSPAQYSSSGSSFVRNVDVLKTGYRLENGGSSCYVSDQAVTVCQAGGNKFFWAGWGGSLSP